MAGEAQRNADILPDHASHPGWDADGCSARITVNNRTHGSGFACGATGGHCLPGSHCPSRRARFETPATTQQQGAGGDER